MNFKKHNSYYPKCFCFVFMKHFYREELRPGITEQNFVDQKFSRKVVEQEFIRLTLLCEMKHFVISTSLSSLRSLELLRFFYKINGLRKFGVI